MSCNRERKLSVTQATHFLIFSRPVQITLTRKQKASHNIQKILIWFELLRKLLVLIFKENPQEITAMLLGQRSIQVSQITSIIRSERFFLGILFILRDVTLSHNAFITLFHSKTREMVKSTYLILAKVFSFFIPSTHYDYIVRLFQLVTA